MDGLDPDRNVDFHKELTWEIVFEAYRQVWTEFYKWEQEATRQDLEALCSQYEDPVDGVSREEEDDTSPLLSREDLLSGWQNFNPDSNEDSTTDDMVVVFPQAEPDATVMRNKVISTVGIEPCSVYEACTPCQETLGPRWFDDNGNDTMKFLPYVDDPGFDPKRDDYAKLHKNLAWLSEEQDPDSTYVCGVSADNALDLCYQSKRSNWRRFSGSGYPDGLWKK